MPKKEFDIHRDSQLVATGSHFWCEGCLVARPLDDQSPDPRYCQGCYDFLRKEAALLTSHRHGKPDWVPVPVLAPCRDSTTREMKGKAMPSISLQGGEVLAATKAIPAKTQPRVGGRPMLDLPFALIKELQDQGHGATEICRQLSDQGIKVSMRTLYRVLSGQRVLV